MSAPTLKPVKPRNWLERFATLDRLATVVTWVFWLGVVATAAELILAVTRSGAVLIPVPRSQPTARVCLTTVPALLQHAGTGLSHPGLSPGVRATWDTASLCTAHPTTGQYLAFAVTLLPLDLLQLGVLYLVMRLARTAARDGVYTAQFARLLLILALAFAYIDGYAPLTVALFAGYLALSFSISDMTRTARELAWGAAALILLSPLIPAFAPTIAAWIFHAKLANLPPPYSSLSVAADIFTHDKLRLITGRGFETVSRGVRGMILPAHTPKALAFTVWYELGIVGAVLAAVGVWLGFRDLDRAPPRLAPFMAAGFTAVVALAFVNVDFDDMTAMTLIAVAVISTDVAARSQYRTKRPSAASLANL